MPKHVKTGAKYFGPGRGYCSGWSWRLVCFAEMSQNSPFYTTATTSYPRPYNLHRNVLCMCTANCYNQNRRHMNDISVKRPRMLSHLSIVMLLIGMSPNTCSGTYVRNCICFIPNLALMSILTHTNCLVPLKRGKTHICRLFRINIGDGSVQHDHRHPTFPAGAV